MTVPLSDEAFYESACGFAQSALQAHHAQDYRRVALEAGTALEHLLKACLAKRSPALLIELKNTDNNFQSLLQLLNIREGGPLRLVRTVSLRDALARVRTFVKSTASWTDLETLVSMRDGTVHAALDDEVEERLLVAFVQHADALLADLGRHRVEFWSPTFLPVIDALLTDASDKFAHEAAVKLAAARAYFQRRYGKEPDELVDLVRNLEEPQGYRDDQVPADCPACQSLGLATGYHHVDWRPDDWEDGEITHVSGTVFFTAWTFECRVCHLRLGSQPEIEATGKEVRWELEGADPLNYEPPIDPDEYHELFRDRY